MGVLQCRRLFSRLGIDFTNISVEVDHKWVYPITFPIKPQGCVPTAWREFLSSKIVIMGVLALITLLLCTPGSALDQAREDTLNPVMGSGSQELDKDPNSSSNMLPDVKHKIKIPTIKNATYGKVYKVIDQHATAEIPAVTHINYHSSELNPLKWYISEKLSDEPTDPAYFFDLWGHRYMRDEPPERTGNCQFSSGNKCYLGFVAKGDYNGYELGEVKLFQNRSEPNLRLPPHQHTIIDKPAIPAEPEISHMESKYIDVTAEVQAVAKMGVSFVFISDPRWGGIYNAARNNLLVYIKDPIPNIEKDVYIEYDSNKTINSVDNKLITL